jgi:integrase
MVKRSFASVVAAMKVGKPKTVFDPETRGLCVRVRNSSKHWQVVAKTPEGKQVWRSIGDATEMPIEKARELAKDVVAEITTGVRPAKIDAPETFAEISDEYLKRDAMKRGLISIDEIRRSLKNHLLPALGEMRFADITRGHVTAMLDKVEDTAGPCASDRTLTRLRRISAWHCDRVGIVDPFRGMKRRISPKERERERILTDAEIRKLWEATDIGTFGALVRMLLLTGQRLEKVSTMRWSDIEDGVWKIPTAAREKGHGGDLVLPEMAMSVLKAQPVFASNPFVFAGRKRHYNGFSKGKARIDAELKLKQQWGLHDLRRTARSLMSRAGVAPHIAERVIGHSMKGVMATYDRHSYREEKAEALELLSVELRRILSPDNVVRLAKRA